MSSSSQKIAFLAFLVVVMALFGALVIRNRILKARKTNSAVLSIITIKENGKSLDWCAANNLIAFGKKGPDGYYDVYIMKPDGSDEICLTDKPGAPKKHNGNPAWHPSGEYIVFTAQNEDAEGHLVDEFAIPGRGFNCNLWLTTKDGSKFWQLTFLPTKKMNQKGVIHPQFSHDGKKLLWAERLGGDGLWGEWVLKIADFVFDENGPLLENITTYQPGDQHLFYESHGFSPDDSWIIFSGNLEEGQIEYGIDIYILNLVTGELKRLTNTFYDWDEHAHYSPDGDWIAWMSSTGFEIDWSSCEGYDWRKYLITELWVMKSDGTAKFQLTHFNDPTYEEYIGSRAIVSDSAWSPDGKKIVAAVAYDTGQGAGSKIVMIELNMNFLEKAEKNLIQVSDLQKVGKTPNASEPEHFE